MDGPKSVASLIVILLLIIASIPYSIAEWVAVGMAPKKAGVYNVIIKATYEGITETYPLQLVVNNTRYPLDGLTVEPVYPLPRRPPIVLKYDIKLNDSYDFDMIYNNLVLYFSSGKSVLKSEEGALTLSSEGFWYANVTVPFKGDYRAVVSIIVEKNGRRFGGDFVSYFRSDEPSSDLVLRHSIERRILIPSEPFEVFLEAEFEGTPLQYLEIFKANLYGVLKDLTWDRQDQAYDATFTAPADEGIYLMSVYAEGQDMLMQDKIYIADISRAKSARCPLTVDSPTGCDDMRDVRKCVYDYRSGLAPLTEQQLITCFEDATGGLIYGSVICNENAKGDFDGDGQRDEADLEIFENMILPLTQSARRDYIDCADYDLDEDVDKQDLECLTNVVAGKWFGDENGGICFDAVYDSALKCDLDGDGFINKGASGGRTSAATAPAARRDSEILQKLIDAADQGIEMPAEILETCDFNQDGRLNLEDRNCMNYFSGMDLDNPETLLSGQTIPDKCMKIYRLDHCQGIRGDINGDLEIDTLDEILMMLIEAKQVASYDMECADVNKDGLITAEDIMCVKSYTVGDRDHYFICIGCDENLPQEYRHEAEICNDGYDNNCDGLIDRTSIGGDDFCSCNENTPCWYVQDADGGASPGIDDGNVKVCRKLSWAGGGTAEGGDSVAGYRWVSPSELECNQGRECQSMECANTEFVCIFDGMTYEWYDDPAKVPPETDDPNAQPKVCDDGHDNDCRCGDVKCAEFEEASMFTSWQFWIGALAGFGLSVILPPAYLIWISAGSSFLGAFCKSPDMRAIMSGMAIGIAVGNMVNAHSLVAKPGETSVGWRDIGKASVKDVYPKVWDQIIHTYARKTLGHVITGAVAGIAAMQASKFFAEKKGDWKHYREEC